MKQELAALLVGEIDAQPIRGCDKELAQGTLMFHVEQLREMAQEVKTSYRNRESPSGEHEASRAIVDFLLCFSRATSSTEMAAGVTPEIRDA